MNVVRYFITGLMLAVIFTTLAALLPSHIESSYLVVGQTGVTPGQRRIVVNLLPKSQTFWCDSSPAYQKLCQTYFDLAAMNNPSIDIVFINNNVYLYDASGVRVIPRP